MTSRTPAALFICAGLATALAALPAHAEDRSIDGTGNNLANPYLGSTNTQMIRESSGAHYADGVGAMITTRPSARLISNTLGAQTVEVDNNALNLSAMWWQWGQFLDHDITLAAAAAAEPARIAVPAGDPMFDPRNTGAATIPFTRSTPGTGPDGARAFDNRITAFIDGSGVYGSDSERASTLRAYEGGRLAERTTDTGSYMPMNTTGLPNANETRRPTDSLYLSGDVRGNEVLGLAALHTLFVREHNRLADQIAAENPAWNDEQIYQRARKIVGAQIQAITYNEFLPALLGEGGISAYTGYDPSVDPSISNAFASSAFRLGHTMLNGEFHLRNADGSDHPLGPVSVRDQFFTAPDIIEQEGAFDAVLRGLAWTEANEIDTQVVDDVRSFLFGPPGAGGLDLLSANIQRGRDHGIADYNTLREDFSLPRVESFDQITSDPEAAAALEWLYGTLDNIDPWIGMMVEDKIAGTGTGGTLSAVLVDQFTRLRDGDRFFYLVDPELAGLINELEATRLSDIIRRNTGAWVQDDAFRVAQVPAPTALALGAAGLAALGARRRRG